MILSSSNFLGPIMEVSGHDLMKDVKDVLFTFNPDG